jgi:hypothetical protein
MILSPAFTRVDGLTTHAHRRALVDSTNPTNHKHFSSSRQPRCSHLRQKPLARQRHAVLLLVSPFHPRTPWAFKRYAISAGQRER